MSGLSSRGGQLPFPSAQGFPRPTHSDRRDVSNQDPSSPHSSQPYMDSEGYDADMVDATAGSSTAVSNAASPEDDRNEEDSQGTKKDAKLKTKMTAIPGYFANGKVPKKRGPKPDSKPARDRRQELNRQAQRNHRQRKEDNQKMLEEALIEATDKARTAMKRAQAAEELRQHMIRGNEHLLRENERLKQLLNVNKIPFEHVIPQQDTLSVDPTGQVNAIQQRGDFVSRSMTSLDATSNKCATAPVTYAAVPPTSTATALPLFVKSNPTDISLNGVSLDSSLSLGSPMEDANGANAKGIGSPSYEYSATSNGQQPILQIDPTSDALTDQPSGPLTGEASLATSGPRSSTTHNCSVAPRMSSYVESSDPPFGRPYPGSTTNASETFMNSSEGTPLSNVQSGNAFAIPDHDQAGVEFILALEANCHDHKTLMNARTFNDPVQLGGHSLMLTKVPISVAKKYRMGDAPHPHELPDVGEGPGKYARLLSLASFGPYSTSKNWTTQTGEISPAQALSMIRKDPRYPMVDSRDFTQLTNNLKDRCRCYGFGAVVEVYEVQDALNDLFTEKGYGLENGYDLDNPFWSRIPLSNPQTLNGPEFPALDGLMDFDIARLMRDRHSDREQFLSADLSTFDPPASSVGHPAENQAPSVTPYTSNTPGFPQMSTFSIEAPTIIPQPPNGQVILETPNTYQYISSKFSPFNA